MQPPAHNPPEGYGIFIENTSDTSFGILFVSACILAVNTGGIPLVFGMTAFLGVFGVILGSFTYKLRRFFPAELTGTMIVIMGINLVSSALGNFMGSSPAAFYRRHFSKSKCR